MEMVLKRDAAGALWLELGGGKPRRVCTVQEASRRLRRSPRQIYRHIAAGLIENAAKMLDQWLLDFNSIERMAGTPLARQPVPNDLRRLLPEYEPSDLNVGRDRVLLISRILENGGLRELRWLERRYKRSEIRGFLREDAARLLSPRQLRLWSLYYRVVPKAVPTWRAADPWKARA